MNVQVGEAVGAMGAAVAGLSWWFEARSPRSFSRRDASLLASWAALTSVGLAAGAVSGTLSAVTAVAVVTGLGCGVLGVAGASQNTVPTAAVARALAESALIGGCALSIGWIAIGAPVSPPRAVYLPLVLTGADLVTAALLLRMPLASNRVVVGARSDRQLLVAAGATALLAIWSGSWLLAALGHASPAGLEPAAGTLAFLVAAAVPWVGRAEVISRPRTSLTNRVLPYALVAVTVAAMCVRAVLAPVGGATVVLVAVVVSSLAAVQFLALRDNGRLLRQLDGSRARLEALIENAGDVILGLDQSGRIVDASAAALPLLHAEPRSLLGRDVAELAELAERPAVREAVWSVVRAGTGTAKIELTLAAPATGTAELRLRGVPGGAVAVVSDVTESVLLRGRLERLARYDQMTGLANRAHVLDELDGWLRGGAAVTLLFADLDGFKAVNDRFGHVAGDGVLAEVSRRIVGAAAVVPPERRIVGRMGGDEFVVGLREVGWAEAERVVRGLLGAIRPPFGVADRTVRLGVSVGVARTDDVSDSGLALGADELLHRADIAMYAAKAVGRSRMVRWDAELEARTVRRVDIAIGLRQALENGRLALAYQPIVRLTDGVVVGVEALIRVRPLPAGPAGEPAAAGLPGLPDLVSPAELVEVAEATGEGGELAQWVLSEATLQGARWSSLGYPVPVSVNMSVRQLSAPGFVQQVRHALATAALPASGLVVEITEGQLVAEGDPVAQVLARLRQDGIELVIDDFGAGYSSLSYLRRMPVRGVKIDKALLEGIGVDERATTLVRAVIGAARGLGLLVVAEGLETLAAVHAVRDLGAWAGQGFALHAALPPDEVTQVLAGAPVAMGLPSVVRIDISNTETAHSAD